jgi:hypothetical protein
MTIISTPWVVLATSTARCIVESGKAGVSGCFGFSG